MPFIFSNKQLEYWETSRGIFRIENNQRNFEWMNESISSANDNTVRRQSSTVQYSTVQSTNDWLTRRQGKAHARRHHYYFDKLSTTLQRDEADLYSSLVYKLDYTSIEYTTLLLCTTVTLLRLLNSRYYTTSSSVEWK